MNRKAVFPFVILSALYSVAAAFIYACCTLWYSDVPERVAILLQYTLFSADLLIIILSLTGMIAVVSGGVVMYRLQLINRTWLAIYVTTPLLVGIMAVEFMLLLSFRQ